MDDSGDEKEGGTGAGGSLEVPWRRWWWRKIPFVSLMIRPFEVVLVDFNQWVLKRIEKDEDWALFEVIWLRNKEDMRLLSFGRVGRHHTKARNKGSTENVNIYSQGHFVINYNPCNRLHEYPVTT